MNTEIALLRNALEAANKQVEILSKSDAHYSYKEQSDGYLSLERALCVLEAFKKEEKKCKCELATKLVGDGCDVCNPDYATDYLDDTDEKQSDTVTISREYISTAILLIQNQHNGRGKIESDRSTYSDIMANTVRVFQSALKGTPL